MELGLRCDALKGNLSKVALGMILREDLLSISSLATMWSKHLTDTCKALLCPRPSTGYFFMGECEVLIGRDIVDYAPKTIHIYVLCYVGFIQNLDQ